MFFALARRFRVSFRWKKRQFRRSLLVRLYSRLLPFRKQFLIYSLVQLIYEITQLIGTYAISAGIRLLLPDAPPLLWFLFPLAVVLYKSLHIGLDTLVDWIIHQVIIATERFLNVQAMEKFLEMRLAWHHQNNSGALVGKVHHGTDKTSQILNTFMWDLTPTLIQAISNSAAVIIFWYFGYQIVAICYASFYVFFRLTIKSYQSRQLLRTRRHNLYEKEWSRFVENVQGIQEIISTNQNTRVLDQYQKLYQRISRLATREQIIGLKYNALRNLIITLSDTLIMMLLLWQVKTGRLEFADLFFLWTTTQRLFHAFWRLGRIFDQTGENSEGFFRLDKLLKQTQIPLFASQPTINLTGQIGFDIKNVVFGYNGTDRVIDNLNLTIPPGKTLAIVGPSGSGKSTLAKMLKGLWSVRSGEVLINDANMYDLTEQQLHDLTAIVNQADNIFIFGTTIEANLRQVKPDATFEEIVRATTIANLHDEIQNFSKGYQTLVGEKGIHLSGGQKQRLAIARAVLRNPQVLILDEPTSGLDMENEIKVKQAIFQSAPGRTTIIIAHRLVTIRDADCIVAMQDGKIVEQGTHQELLSLGGVYARLHQLDQQSLKALSD